MPTVRDILARKGTHVLLVGKDATVLQAALLMNEHKVGSLVVVDADRIAGMFTERDVLRRVVGEQRDPSRTCVGDVMTTDVLCCQLDTSLEEVGSVMKERRIRHLPVVGEEGRLLGLISIGDINAYYAASQEQTIFLLNEYLYGRVWPAGVCRLEACMTWIKTVPPDEAGPELRQCYEAVYALYPPEYRDPVASLLRPDGGADSITAAHSLIPEAMRHAMSTYGVLLRPDLPLSRRQHEMIATVVSAHNRCFYWTESHAEFLRRVSLDEGLAAALRRDYREADLSDQDRAMLDFVVRVTADAARTTPADLEGLRRAGFDDRAVLQITMIAAWFCYVNRVADALGVGRWTQRRGVSPPVLPSPAGSRPAAAQLNR